MSISIDAASPISVITCSFAMPANAFKSRCQRELIIHSANIAGSEKLPRDL